jgi:hypothetical protein
MAIWQFRLVFVPEKALLSMYDVLPAVIPQELASEARWWSDFQPPIGFEKWIDLILPAAAPWSTRLSLWGQKHGDEARVFYVDETKTKVEHLAFRIDVRDLSRELVHRVCMLAKRLDCVLMTAERTVLVPDESMVITAVANSTAKKYLDDPEATLLNLDQKKFEYPREEKKKKPPRRN